MSTQPGAVPRCLGRLAVPRRDRGGPARGPAQAAARGGARRDCSAGETRRRQRRRSDHRGDQPQPRRRRRGRTLSSGPLRAAEPVRDSCCPRCGSDGRTCPCGSSDSRRAGGMPVTSRRGHGCCSPRRRWSPCSYTAGRRTSAGSTSSSTRSRPAPATTRSPARMLPDWLQTPTKPRPEGRRENPVGPPRQAGSRDPREVTEGPRLERGRGRSRVRARPKADLSLDRGLRHRARTLSRPRSLPGRIARWDGNRSRHCWARPWAGRASTTRSTAKTINSASRTA